MTKEDQILLTLKKLEDGQDSMLKAISHNSVRTKRIEDKLIGDKEMKTPGLIDQVENIEKDFSAFKEENKGRIMAEQLNKKYTKGKKVGITLGIGLASGGAGMGIWELIKSLL